MKILDNQIPEVRTNIQPIIDRDVYYCQHCGAENSVTAHYTEVGYGRADVTSIDGDLGDCEVDDYDNFEVNCYKCDECDREQTHLADLITSDPPEEEEEELEEEE